MIDEESIEHKMNTFSLIFEHIIIYQKHTSFRILCFFLLLLSAPILTNFTAISSLIKIALPDFCKQPIKSISMLNWQFQHFFHLVTRILIMNCIFYNLRNFHLLLSFSLLSFTMIWFLTSLVSASLSSIGYCNKFTYCLLLDSSILISFWYSISGSSAKFPITDMPFIVELSLSNKPFQYFCR